MYNKYEKLTKEDILEDLYNYEIDKIIYRQTYGEEVDDPYNIIDELANEFIDAYILEFDDYLEEIYDSGELDAAMAATYSPNQTFIPDTTFVMGLFNKRLDAFWSSDKRTTISAALATMYLLAVQRMNRTVAVLNSNDLQILTQLTNASLIWMTEGTKLSVLTPILTQTLTTAIENQLSLAEATALVRSELLDLVPPRATVYLTTLSGILVNMTRNMARVVEANNQGFSGMMWLGFESDNQCDRCAALEGTIFPISGLMTLVDQISNASTPEAFASVHPFPSWNSRDSSFVLPNGNQLSSNASPEEFISADIGLPPLHGECVCQLVPV